MKVLFYSNSCQFCKELLGRLEMSKIKEDIKTICIDENTSFTQVKIVPTIIDSDYNEILEGKKAFDYLKNKDFFDFPTNNFLIWKEKEVPDPKIKNDKLANENGVSNLLNNVEFDKKTDPIELNTLYSNECKDSNESKESIFKDVKINKRSAMLLRRRK